MENLLNYLNAHPIFWVVLIVLVVFLILTSAKRLFKLFIVLVVIGLLVVGYLYLSNRGIVPSKEELIEQGKSLLEKGKDAGKDIIEEGKEAGEDLIEKGKKELQKKTTD
ncbi:MAG: hypothetical protein J7M10_07355 [Candidatus Cloacimonetes bacterium]|nr:hypothetical protein [Candidatus Cloacimonadota bacterium]